MSSIRVELPISSLSNLVSKHKTIGDLKKTYPKLSFIKYIYLDPVDQKMKGANPPDDLPIVADAYITVVGELEDIIKFATDATTNARTL